MCIRDSIRILLIFLAVLACLLFGHVTVKVRWKIMLRILEKISDIAGKQLLELEQIYNNYQSFVVKKCHSLCERTFLWLPVTGSALALHCCEAHERINRKTWNSTPCKIVTPENFSSNVCTRDYVRDCNYCANFCENRFSGSFSPNRWDITPLWLFDCHIYYSVSSSKSFKIWIR